MLIQWKLKEWDICCQERQTSAFLEFCDQNSKDGCKTCVIGQNWEVSTWFDSDDKSLKSISGVSGRVLILLNEEV